MRLNLLPAVANATARIDRRAALVSFCETCGSGIVLATIEVPALIRVHPSSRSIALAWKSVASVIHHRMPVILPTADYVRWLGEEDNPRELMRPFPSQAMRMWPISTRVNKPENDDPSILDPIERKTDAA